MHAKLCPKDFEMLPLPLERRFVTRANTSTPDHVVSIPAAETHQLDRSIIHTASKFGAVSQTNNNFSYGAQVFKSYVHMFLLENGNS